MRITSTMSYLNLMQGINRAQERTQAAQNQVSSGKKAVNFSDDPTAAADIVQLTSESAEADQYAKNVTFGQCKLQVTDGVLDNVQQMVERARTLGQSSLGDLTTSSANHVARASNLSQEQDADLPTAISEMTQSQQTLQAAMAVGARVSQLSILDFPQ